MSNNTADIKENPRKYLSAKYLAFSIGLSLAGMGVVVYLTYKPGVLEHLAPKRLPGLFIALAVSFLRLWFSAAKIRHLSDKELGWMASFRVMLCWDFASSVTPSTIGGAPLATYAMTKEGYQLGKSTAIILYGVLLDQMWFALAVPILLVMALFFPIVPSNLGMVGHISMLLLYLGILAYAGLMFYGVLKNPAAIKKVVNYIFKLPFLRRWQDKVVEEAENLEEYSEKLSEKSNRFLYQAFFLSTMSWICRVALPTIVVLSLVPADVILSFLRSLAMNLAFLIVPTPGGSGGAEALFAIFQGPLMEREGFIGLAVFLWRIISYYISVGLGMMALTWYINRSVVNRRDQKSTEPSEEISSPKSMSQNG